MMIQTKKSQVGKEFKADLWCENCGTQVENVECYDDEYFHHVELPNRKCTHCTLSSNLIKLHREDVRDTESNHAYKGAIS